jgi:hypothetical protein
MGRPRGSSGALGGLLAGACVVQDERAVVGCAPGQCQLAGRYATDWAGDHAFQGNQGRVPCGQQANTSAVHERLVGLVCAGDLGADAWRPASTSIEGKPVVPQRAGAYGQREERLVQQLAKSITSRLASGWVSGMATRRGSSATTTHV